jgi:hypothetical protein
LPSSALRLPGLWQSALKFRLLTVAIRATDILFVAIRGLNAADCHNPRYTFESPCLNSHIFLPLDFQIIKYLLGGLFRPKLNNNGLSLYSTRFSWHYTFKHVGESVWSYAYPKQTDIVQFMYLKFWLKLKFIMLIFDLKQCGMFKFARCTVVYTMKAKMVL